MSTKSFYVQKTKRLHTKYNLSANATRLLKCLDDYHMGSIDEAELGRIVRLSPSMRKAVTETISKCASVMEKKPTEMKDCIVLIQNCTEILSIADKPSITTGFPFMKCPKEIQIEVYERYIQRNLTYNFDLMPASKRSSCACSGHESTYYSHRKINFSLAATSKAIRDEFLSYLYSRQMINYCCVCDMNVHLANNELMRNSIRAIKVHWCGPDADAGFKALGRCTSLRRLILVVSKATTFRLTKRQTEMARFFASQRPARLYDALGVDELLQIRGLHEVKVLHILAKQGSRRTDEEKASLQALLTARLVGPRNEGDSN